LLDTEVFHEEQNSIDRPHRPGRVLTCGELIETISGYEYEGYERTIDVQIKNIRKVLEDDPAGPKLLLTVRGVGYKAQE